MIFRNLIAAAALTGLSVSANAASISLIYVGDADVVDGAVQALVGDVVTFDVYMDFTDDPTIGGAFDIIFDTAGLAFESYDYFVLGDPGFGRPPDVLDGLLESAAFGDFVGVTGPATVGTVSFTVTDTGIFDIDLALGGRYGFFSADFVSIIDVDFGSATVMSSVPLPAAVWCMLSGLGVLVGLRKQGEVARPK